MENRATQEGMSYVALCKTCGGMTVAVVAEPASLRGNRIRVLNDAMRRGEIVKMVRSELVRTTLVFCRCGKSVGARHNKAIQKRLF